MEPHDAVGQYELKECQLWGERLQEGFVPVLSDGMIPSDPGVDFSDAIKNPIIVLIADAAGNIH